MTLVEVKRPKLAPAGMRLGDVMRVGAIGLRTRPLRAFLSALGIAIGIAAMVGVVGLSSSSGAELDRTLSALGTNLLTVTSGTTLAGEAAQMPKDAEAMIERIGPVQAASAVAKVSEAKVYRSEQIPEAQTGGITTYAARLDLLATVGATLRSGTWLNQATERYPAAVLGSAAAQRLGIGSVSQDTQVVVGGERFTVVGVLNPVALATDLDSGVMVGWPVAEERLDFDGHPTTLYTRSEEAKLEAVRQVLAGTANPEAPNEIDVSRPSDALAAKQATSQAFANLLLGVGAVALLVGGVGVANTMVISVLERRAEIGLRRSLGATRGQIRTQFLAESLLLSAIGGAGGVLLGTAVTMGYALYSGWPSVVPAWATVGGLAATLMIGAMAGLYPAIRASRLSPTEALATP
ncbi:putative ABC transport system permease protein [Nonomuraea polychroma]|uniref:Putative ABC transport system permease protein n=1 Tax=Nonomuraea polychroma TaxID=46176 RepID=A0A438MEA0_9ACTN|nr:ABC transporter permease [Nonomuraea polychroma]RVX44054.1 putative ABC transport system permease protein [Nonomuraea polychroma]